jgi:hypothetical protein
MLLQSRLDSAAEYRVAREVGCRWVRLASYEIQSRRCVRNEKYLTGQLLSCEKDEKGRKYQDHVADRGLLGGNTSG